MAGYTPSVRVTTLLRGGAPGTGGFKSWFVSDDPVFELPVNAVLKFRKAGDKADAELPLNDIAALSLSL